MEDDFVPHRKKKATKKWCKGKPGILHQWGGEVNLFPNFNPEVVGIMWQKRCKVCGKQSLRIEEVTHDDKLGS